MPSIAEIMSTDVQTIEPQQSLRAAAQLMEQLDVGALPVCDGQKLLGMLTDRDIAVRAVAQGLTPDAACVSDIMTPDVDYCTEDQDTQEVMRQMGDKQIRRLPVVDRDKKLVGIVSLGDLATRHDGHTDRVLEEISEPGSASSSAAR
jgi:CBS domain-containing protein